MPDEDAHVNGLGLRIPTMRAIGSEATGIAIPDLRLTRRLANCSNASLANLRDLRQRRGDVKALLSTVAGRTGRVWPSYNKRNGR